MSELNSDQKTFKIKLPDKSIFDISGSLIKLKGYSKFFFFSHKIDKEWQIRELTTGLRLGRGSTEAQAKKISREYLSKETGGDLNKLSDKILSKEILNPII